MEKLFIVIPAYNEAANIARVIREWYIVASAHGAASRLVIVDDGSRDDTAQIVRDTAQTVRDTAQTVRDTAQIVRDTVEVPGRCGTLQDGGPADAASGAACGTHRSQEAAERVHGTSGDAVELFGALSVRECAGIAFEEELFLMPGGSSIALLRRENGGHGAALYLGYLYALSEGADFIFQTDSDGQTLPAEFEGFWQIRNRYDMVIGRRGHRRDGWTRVLVTRVLRAVLLLTFRTYVEDANTPYRLMKAEALRDVMESVPPEYFLTNVLVSVCMLRHGKRVRFLPITFRQRQGGVNSINLKKIVRIGLKSLREFRLLSRRI